MQPLARRQPFFKSLFFVGLICLGLCAYALTTATMFIPGTHGQRDKVFTRSGNPREYQHSLRFFSVVGCVCVLIAFVRFVPVEDRLSAMGQAHRRRIEKSGVAKNPAPVWAYVFLAGFIALVIYLGYVFMYRE